MEKINALPNSSDVKSIWFREGKIKELDPQTKTYKIDYKNNRLQGRIDKFEALLQRIEKELATEKFMYPIYPSYYGLYTKDLLGIDKDLSMLRLKSRLEEMFEKYEDIKEVTDFIIIESKDRSVLGLEFSVISNYGEARLNKVVQN